MKNQLILFFIAIAMLTSCSKNGEQGIKGDKGEQGEQGIPGVKGIDGTTVLSGNGIPQKTLGKDGDYYLDLASGNFYGPKSANGWGNPISLKGDKGNNGENGKDGLSLLSGNGSPSMGLGKVGDLYFNLNTLTIHGPKNQDNWGGEFSLASTQKSGVQIYLIKNVKFKTPTNTTTDYNSTKPYFYYKNNEINIGNLNIKKGISFIYWRYNGMIGDTGPLLNNYFTFDWKQVIANGQDENHSYENINMNLRIDPLKIGYDLITKTNFLQFLLIGNEVLSTNQTPNVNQFYNFKESAAFDILIKYIPEASADLIQAKGANINELLKIK